MEEEEEGKQHPKGYVIRNGKMVGIKIKKSKFVSILQNKYSECDTVLIQYLNCCERQQRSGHCYIKSDALDLQFRISSSVWSYNCVKNALLNSGLSHSTKEKNWNVLWAKHLSKSEMNSLTKSQVVNHFPGSSVMGSKDKLALLMRNKATALTFVPKSFVLPSEYSYLVAYCKTSQSQTETKKKWILKPFSASCGRGIRLVSNIQTVKNYRGMIAQEYLGKPYLINGSKFDLRLYVLVTSYDPLIVYLCDDGLVRLCTSMYKEGSMSKQSHLTNYSVQKNYENYDRNKHKWNIKKLWTYLKTTNKKYCKQEIQDRINHVIIQTLMFASKRIQKVMFGQCFEIYGFDLLLDWQLNAWLLEVNLYPSFSSSSPSDKKIKSTLMCDVFHCIGLKAANIAQERKENEPIKPPSNESLLQEIADQFNRKSNLQLIFPQIQYLHKYHVLHTNATNQDYLLWNFLNLPTNQQLYILHGKSTNQYLNSLTQRYNCPECKAVCTLDRRLKPSSKRASTASTLKKRKKNKKRSGTKRILKSRRSSTSSSTSSSIKSYRSLTPLKTMYPVKKNNIEF